MWNQLNKIQRFTPIRNLENVTTKLQLPNKPVYYLGSGFHISYTDIQFKVEDLEKKEYGEAGEYCLNIYFFKLRSDLIKYFNLNPEDMGSYSDVNNNFEVLEGISINSTYNEIINVLKGKNQGHNLQTGESRRLINEEFMFHYDYINWNNYIFMFFDKSKNAKLRSFQYTLQ
ncbi:hypothetical protein HQN89_36865 [Paenibacillus frigoriresistens]|uniref:hypothetical protein n=1 Tax=Paenibacillus alginolyticus TaxID=59839 RepID=UPI0015650A66|nr:hypothetical protein [Paenibacillus frigoriresistens]NRF96320.1 hypothetical protein [Paenibacillus frigoriresistens]